MSAGLRPLADDLQAARDARRAGGRRTPLRHGGRGPGPHPGGAADWLLEGYSARGSVALLAALPKAGKSTLAVALAEAVAAPGVDAFLGLDVATGPAVLLSEEGDGTLRHKLPDSDELHVLSRDGRTRARPGPR